MKKLLIPSFVLMASLAVVSCGPSEEEKKTMQEENEAMINEKVNEIMQKLETAAPSIEEGVSDSMGGGSEELPQDTL